MASQPQLPLFYRNITILSSEQHAKWGIAERKDLAFARATHAVPITVDEFVICQRYYPIVFSVAEGSVPLALVGLQEGKNLFVNEEGTWQPDTYIPGYIRRHPFIFVRGETPDQLALAFDSSWDLLGEDADNKLFNDDLTQTDTLKNLMEFCGQFEQGIARTRSFVDELEKLELLMDGQAQIRNPDMEKPATFAGFRMIDEKKLQNLRGDKARRMVQNGMMGLVYAHLFSLSQVRDLFGKMTPDEQRKVTDRSN